MSGSVFPLDGTWMDEDERWLLCLDGETVWLARRDVPDGAVNGDAGPRFARTSRTAHCRAPSTPWPTA
jgi:hypothetical protein